MPAIFPERNDFYPSPSTVDGVVEFLRSRKKAEGGFSASPKLPATIEDTYCALKVVHFLENLKSNVANFGSFKRGPTKFLIRCIDEGIVKGPKNLYQVLWCVEFCEFEKSLLQKVPIADKFLTGASLEAFYYLTKTREILPLKCVANLGVPEIPVKDFLASGTLEERWKALYICFASGCLENRSQFDEIVEWVLQCQNSDGGFGFLPGTTSYIENCHFALNILRILNSALPSWRRKAVKQFAIACRTRSGGFSRRPDAAPFMDSTYHAMAVLSDF